MEYLKTTMSAALAGFVIGIGGLAFLSIDSKIVGALFFTIGLFVICTQGLHLYTGRVCYVFRRDLKYASFIPFIWAGNFIGTYAVALMTHITRISASVSEKAAGMCQTKMGDSYLSLFVLAMLCNVLIFIAIDGFRNNKHELGKYLGLFFGVAVFIICGFEHSVADMFYISCANMWSGEAFLRIVIISLGNAVGGILATTFRKWFFVEN